MRLIFRVLIFMVLAHVIDAQQRGDLGIRGMNRSEPISFCDLLDEPVAYEGKIIRTTAILSYGGEDFVVLYCPRCASRGILRPVFTEYFRNKTKGKYIGRLPLLKNSSGTIKLTLTGTLSTQQFLIDSVDNVKYVSREYGVPDRLSEKVRRNIDCN